MPLQLNLTTLSGVACPKSFTVITHMSIKLVMVLGKATYPCATVANLYLDKATWSAGAEPLDTFHWSFDYNPACSGKGVGCLIDQAENSLLASTSIRGTALPGSTSTIHKHRNFNFTGGTKV